MPTIDRSADELTAAAAAIRGVIEGDRYPHAPRLDPLRAALARLEAAASRNLESTNSQHAADSTGAAKAPAAKGDKRTRREKRYGLTRERSQVSTRNIAKLTSKGAAAMSAEDIGNQAESTAEWRRSKAAQFPDDTRNLRAAEELGRLAREIETLSGSEVYRQVDEAEESLLAANAPDVWIDINEAMSAELRSIGFGGGHGAAGLLEWYRDLVREKLQVVLAASSDFDEPAADKARLVEAVLSIIEASRAYLPGEMSKDVFITKVLEATDNPRIIAALAAHGHQVSPVD